MCGITGLAAPRPVNENTVRKMTDLLAHRGPDDHGYWTSRDAKVCFGHRRLSIIDTSAAGRQPMVKGKTVITYNGELYNYIELRARLQADGISFQSSSDTEVVLEAYRQWGPACLSEFNGMFAFAIYDEAQERLFCARDRFGEKPFLYSFNTDFFGFASEYKSLLNLEGISREIDQLSLLRFLNNPSVGLDDSETTLFRSISQLLPAHSLTLDLKSFELETRQYWAPEVDQMLAAWIKRKSKASFVSS